MVIASQRKELANLGDAAAREQREHLLYERRRQCAAQAKEVFSRYRQPEDLATFENHHHVTSGRCFVAVSTTTANPVASVNYVWDAFEDKEYARYARSNPNGLPYEHVKPMQCKVVDKDGQSQRCQSFREFDALVKAYMTE